MTSWLSGLTSFSEHSAWRPLAPALAFIFVAGLLGLAGLLTLSLGRLTGGRRPLVFGPLTWLLGMLPPIAGQSARRLQADLRQAGRYRPQAALEFAAIRNALVLGAALLTCATLWAVRLGAPQRDPKLLVCCLGGMLAMILFSVPRLWLQAAAKARVRRIQTGLPDALDMVTMCMTGGLPLQQSLERVSHELDQSHPDVALELAIIRRQAEAFTLEHAMSQFAVRIEAPEIGSLSALVSQTERLGANVAVALREFADGIRRAFRQRAEERGNRTSVKMLLPVALCLAPPVYILLLAPALLELQTFVQRENRPGGVLAPTAAQAPQNP